jgi:hypothetical protein
MSTELEIQPVQQQMLLRSNTRGLFNGRSSHQRSREFTNAGSTPNKKLYLYFDLYVYSRAVLFLLQEQPHIFDSRFCTLPVGATSDRNVVNQF